MRTLAYANDGARFALELASLAAFAFWGSHAGGTLAARVALATVVPAVAATAWGLLLSPKARFPLRGWSRPAFEVLFFGGAVAALIVSGEHVLAAILGGLASLHLGVLYGTGHRRTISPG